MKSRPFAFFVLLAVLVSPAIVSAAWGWPGGGGSGGATPGTIQALITQIGAIIASLIPIAFGLGVVAFFWGLAKYIFSAGDEGAKEEGKNIMIWGVIALFVMSAVWGIVEVVRKTLGVGDEKTVTIPYL